MGSYDILTGVGVLSDSSVYDRALAKRERDLPLVESRLARIKERILPLFEKSELAGWFKDSKYSKITTTALNHNPELRLSDLVDKNNNAYSDTYSPTHKEYFSGELTRFGDEMFHWNFLIDRYQRLIRDAIFADGKRKNVLWRIIPEIGFFDAAQIIEVREDGPDKDFLSDVMCIKDHDWFAIKMYARFSVDG